MTSTDILLKMIDFSDGNLHDIAHFMKVHGYAQAIAKAEGLDKDTVEFIEVAALVHDIACPLCRLKYGNTNGKYQELEGIELTKEFLKDTGYSDKFIERVAYLVGHHHTLNAIDGIDYQILIEADYLVNADESKYSKENIANMAEKYFKTKTGLAMLKSIYKL